jgi:hypothetical protein
VTAGRGAIHNGYGRFRHRPGAGSPLEVELVGTAADVTAAEWAALAREEEPIWSQAFFAAMEADGLGFDGLAYLLFKHEGRVAAILPVFWNRGFSMPPPDGAGVLRRHLPAIGMLFCGHPLAAGRVLGQPKELDRDILLGAVRHLARHLRLGWYVLKDFGALPHGIGTAQRLATAAALPDAVIDLPSTFDEYLRGLKPKARRNARRKLRDLAAADVTFEVVDDFAALVPAMVNLYEQVLARAAVRLDVLGPAFFEAVAAADLDRRVVVCWRDGRMIGFVLCLLSENVCVALRSGLDYGEARRFGVWFGLHYRVIELGCAHGCRRLNLLQSTYRAKKEIGARFEPLSVHVGHTNPTLRALARLVVPRVLEREWAAVLPA